MASDADYHSLREQIEGLLSEGQLHRKQATEARKVETFWYIGDALISHFLTRPDATYGEQIVRNLSKDIGIGLLPDEEQIRRYQALSEQHSWSTRQLMRAIEAEHGPDLLAADLSALSDRPLRARFGHLPRRRRSPAPRPAGRHRLRLPPDPADLPGFARARPGDTVTLQSASTGRTRACAASTPPSSIPAPAATPAPSSSRLCRGSTSSELVPRHHHLAHRRLRPLPGRSEVPAG